MARRTEPLVSVVTPVYNGADYIVESIESVLAQSHRNWHHTIVDNASTDATPELVEKLAARDSRIRLQRFEEFVPMTENHNRAFRATAPESEFCKFVSADDWLFPECLKLMVGVASSQPSIGLVASYHLWGTQLDHVVQVPHTQSLVPGRQFLHDWLLGRGDVINGVPTALLLRSTCVRERDPFYRSDFYHPDTEVAQWLLNSFDMGFVHQVLTFSRRQPGATIERTLHLGSLRAERIRLLMQYGPGVLSHEEYRARLRWRLCSYIWFHLRQVPKLSRLREPEFFSIHRRETALILEECRGDKEVEAAITLVRALLQRGGSSGKSDESFSWD
jgi:glycosyltransferase involved in cell wall biosynthesis